MSYKNADTFLLLSVC